MTVLKAALAVAGLVAIALYAIRSGLIERIVEWLRELYHDLQWKIIAFELKRRGPR